MRNKKIILLDIQWVYSFFFIYLFLIISSAYLPAQQISESDEMKLEETKKEMEQLEKYYKSIKQTLYTYDNQLIQPYYTFSLSEKTPVFQNVTFENVGNSSISFWPVFNGIDWSCKNGIKEFILKQHPDYPDISEEEIPMLVCRYIFKYRYHFSPATGNSWLHNPLIFFNVFGYGFCDDSANTTECILEALFNYPSENARVWGLSGHVVPECFFDNSWKVIDIDYAYYTQNSFLLGMDQLSSEYNWVITKVHGSSTIAGYYSTTGNNVIINHQWYNDIDNLQHILKPGEKLELSRTNTGNYYSVLYTENVPYTSHRGEGKIIIDKIAQNINSYNNSNINVENNKIYATDSSGWIDVNLSTPYVFTAITAEITTDFSIDKSVSVYYNNTLAYESDSTTNSLINIGTKYNITRTWPPTCNKTIRINLKEGQKIADIKIIGVFQVSNYSWPQFATSNDLLIKTNDDVNLKMNLTVSDIGMCNPPENVSYNPSLNRINWTAPQGTSPNNYRYIITKDDNALFPIQPLITEKTISAGNSNGIDLNSIQNIDCFLTQGEQYYLRVESLFSYYITKSSQVVPIFYKGNLAKVDEWKSN